MAVQDSRITSSSTVRFRRFAIAVRIAGARQMGQFLTSLLGSDWCEWGSLPDCWWTHFEAFDFRSGPALCRTHFRSAVWLSISHGCTLPWDWRSAFAFTDPFPGEGLCFAKAPEAAAYCCHCLGAFEALWRGFPLGSVGPVFGSRLFCGARRS